MKEKQLQKHRIVLPLLTTDNEDRYMSIDQQVRNFKLTMIEIEK